MGSSIQVVFNMTWNNLTQALLNSTGIDVALLQAQLDALAASNPVFQGDHM